MRDAFVKLRILLDLLRHAYEQWQEDVWDKDLDSRYCCNGQECGCGGVTLRDVYDPENMQE